MRFQWLVYTLVGVVLAQIPAGAAVNRKAVVKQTHPAIRIAAPLAAPPAIPEYPGSEPRMVLSLTNADLLPIIKDFVGKIKFGGAFDDKTKGKKAETMVDVKKIIQGISGVTYTELFVKAKDDTGIVRFYEDAAANWNMRRVFWQKQDDEIIAVYSGIGGSSLYGYHLGLTHFQDPKGNPSVECEVKVARINGTLNLGNDLFKVAEGYLH